MSAHISTQRVEPTPRTRRLESLIASANRRGQPPAELAPIMVRYWVEYPSTTREERFDALVALQSRVRTSELWPRALAPFVLCDADEDVVSTAAVAMLGAHPVSLERRQAAIDDALDWIRRGLAVNRAVVFATLLGCADATINSGLAGLRLLLSREEVGVVCRRTKGHANATTVEFFREWLALLDALDGADPAVRRLVASAATAAAG
jgi:hypothetical protein